MNAFPAMPLISIVTASLNQSQFLRDALASVSNQAYPRVEHLVLDGGSNDSSRVLLEEHSQNSDSQSFWWRSAPDGGQSEALNEGFEKASGEIVGWLNADDRYRPECFATVARTFQEHPEVDVIYGDYTFMDAAGKHISLRREIEFSRFVLCYHRVLYIPTAATFFRKRIFEEGNFLRPSLHYAMDLEFFLRLSRAGYQFHHLAEVLADFRVHSSSKSVAFRDRHREEHRSVVLSSTPLSATFKSVQARNFAANFLQVPAALMRYSEKLRRGLYFSSPELPAREPASGRAQEHL